MLVNLVGPFVVNDPFGTEIAFSKGLKALGVRVNEVDPNLPGQRFEFDADFTVVFKTAMRYNDRLLEMKGPVVVYQPDDLHYPHIRQMMLEMKSYSKHALVFQRYGVDECKSLGFETASTLGLTADPYLYRPLRCKKDIDLCFVGSLGDPYAHASRRRMIQVLLSNGFNVQFTSTNDVHVVNEIYNRSKVVLNHAADVGYGFGLGRGYQCRHFEVGFSATCLLSNKLRDQEEFTIGSHFLYGDEKELCEFAKDLVGNPGLTDLYGQMLFEEMMEFHHPVVRAKQLIDILGTL